MKNKIKIKAPKLIGSGSSKGFTRNVYQVGDVKYTFIKLERKHG